MSLEERIDNFVKAADEVTAAHWQSMGYTHSKPPTHRADFISEKWCRVVTMEERGGKLQPSSVYAFIALQDNTTKTLGNVKTGDIHKPASYKVPAKHSRGSVFTEDFGKNCLNSCGPNYMKESRTH